MKKFMVSILAIIMIVGIFAIPTEAGESWIENKFVFGSYAPVVKFSIKGLEDKRWITADSQGNLKSTTKAGAKEFVILPAEEQGWYIIRDAVNPNFCLTFTNNIFCMDVPDHNEYYMQVFRNTQKFKFIWKTGYKQGSRNLKCNGWHLICMEKNKVVTCSGYSVLGMNRVN